MRLRFAIWEDGPACYVDEVHLPEFERQGIGVGGGLQRLRIDIFESAVTIRPMLDGVMIVPDKSADISPLIIKDVGCSYVARCSVMPLDFNWRDDHWHADLPLPHLLPWPIYHEYERGNFNKHDAVLREIKVRVDSAHRHTGSPAINVGKHAQAILTGPERVKLFTEWEI